jgi:hypothetical protein
MPGDRRRFTIAYACSLIIHAIALALLALFVLRDLVEGGASEAVVADTQITVRTETPAPAPVLRPRRAAIPVPVRPHPRPAASVRPQPPVPRELARIVPKATPEPPTPPPAPIAAELPPSPAPTVRATVQPTIAPTAQPTVAPTLRPTPEPTLRPTPEPTLRPTPEPTVRPTSEPTAQPTARPTNEPTIRPTTEPTAVPTAHATSAPSPSPTLVAERPVPRATANAQAAGTAPTARPVAAPAPARLAIPATPLPAPVHIAVALATPSASPAPAPTPAPGLASLNDRLRAALPTKPTAGMQRVDLGAGYSTQRVLDAYEASLAPPLEILAKTFGLIYTTRTTFRADSVAYVYERTHDVVLGHDVCHAYRITEHPLRQVVAAPDVSKPGGVSFPGPPSDDKPDIERVDVACDAKGMIKVEPGSLKSPVPRHPPA